MTNEMREAFEPLTDEDIMMVLSETTTYEEDLPLPDLISFARAIEKLSSQVACKWQIEKDAKICETNVPDSMVSAGDYCVELAMKNCVNAIRNQEKE